jgi:small subunit ribosomal protein S2
MLRREAGRLAKNLDGIRSWTKFPAALFIVDIKREHNAVAEARRLKIPIVAIVDTNCDPDLRSTTRSPATTTPSARSA